MATAMIGEGLGFVLLALAVPLPAPPVPAAALTAHDFDLADLASGRAARSLPASRNYRFAAPPHDPAALGDTGWVPPARSWGEQGKGPVIELGALGSRRKGLPDVVHLSLDWDF